MQFRREGERRKFLRRCVLSAIVYGRVAMLRSSLRGGSRTISLHLERAIALFRRLGDYAAVMAMSWRKSPLLSTCSRQLQEFGSRRLETSSVNAVQSDTMGLTAATVSCRSKSFSADSVRLRARASRVCGLLNRRSSSMLLLLGWRSCGTEPVTPEDSSCLKAEVGTGGSHARAYCHR